MTTGNEVSEAVRRRASIKMIITIVLAWIGVAAAFVGVLILGSLIWFFAACVPDANCFRFG